MSTKDYAKRVERRISRIAERTETLPLSVRSLVLFVGWQRSGNSFVGQALNAHRDALIANEGQVFGLFAERPDRDWVYRHLCDLDEKRAASGYDKKARGTGPEQILTIEGAWQGKTPDPIAIGFSKAGATARTFAEDPELFGSFLAEMRLDPKFLFQTRHPREMVASMMRRRLIPVEQAVDELWESTEQVSAAHSYLAQSYNTLLYRYEDFVDDVDVTLNSLFSFLGLRSDPALNAAVKKACFSKPERPSEGTPEIRAFDDRIEELIANFAVFEGYRSSD
ncbi:MAG: sulfotransferase [Pseudomonadota bacterium]